MKMRPVPDIVDDNADLDLKVLRQADQWGVNQPERILRLGVLQVTLNKEGAVSNVVVEQIASEVFDRRSHAINVIGAVLGLRVSCHHRGNSTIISAPADG